MSNFPSLLSSVSLQLTLFSQLGLIYLSFLTHIETTISPAVLLPFFRVSVSSPAPSYIFVFLALYSRSLVFWSSIVSTPFWLIDPSLVSSRQMTVASSRFKLPRLLACLVLVSRLSGKQCLYSATILSFLRSTA